jgi:hypothetical protein
MAMAMAMATAMAQVAKREPFDRWAVSTGTSCPMPA